MQVYTITGRPTELRPGETVRLHTTKTGDVIPMPCEMSISKSVIGLKPVKTEARMCAVEKFFTHKLYA